jgi:hypothetical protein
MEQERRVNAEVGVVSAEDEEHAVGGVQGNLSGSEMCR